MLIDVETYEYFSVHSSGSEGVLVLIQHYRDIPLMRKESFVLAPGHEADVGLSITEITTSSNAISRFTPEERDCYVHDEVNLKSLPLKKGYRMSMKNCLYDKALHATKARCGCKPPFYVLGALGKWARDRESTVIPIFVFVAVFISNGKLYNEKGSMDFCN